MKSCCRCCWACPRRSCCCCRGGAVSCGAFCHLTPQTNFLWKRKWYFARILFVHKLESEQTTSTILGQELAWLSWCSPCFFMSSTMEPRTYCTLYHAYENIIPCYGRQYLDEEFTSWINNSNYLPIRQIMEEVMLPFPNNLHFPVCNTRFSVVEGCKTHCMKANKKMLGRKEGIKNDLNLTNLS